MIQIAAGVGLFFLGVLVGALFHRSFQGETAKNKRLEQKISELEQEATRYQADVTEHFMETAELVKTMNKSYRDVHNHLAKSANRLCGTDQANDFLQIASAGDEIKKGKVIDSDSAQTPPMDYAPKSADEEGTLSESYGLKDEETAEAEAESSEAPKEKEETKA